MGEFDVFQRTKDGYFDAKALEKNWFKSKPIKKEIRQFLNLKKTKEFIKEIEKPSVENYSTEKQAVIHKISRITKTGKTPEQYWLHPYLFIDFAMWLNPKFKLKVIEFVYDQLIEFRDVAGDLYKDLTRAVTKFNDVNYSQLAKGLNYIIFGRHENGIRQTATKDQLKAMNDLQNKLAFAVDMMYIKSFNELINEMRRIFNINQYKYV